ncbi:putative ABC bile acid transporter [Sclerotinia borealis F-4128]|uniref:Putative ABC bile acid transporter n=1 Tax=Sclerotinia borealis (strain F-4128) TaxID=1432307 RepID=W9CI94_SCLBF|nr:putative ABC bile acid transporter [Sclerotinia borealis F-4128]
MLDYNSGSLAAAICCLLVVTVLTFPSVFSILSHFREKGKQDPNNYKDKDGVSTEETIAAFSTKVPKTLLVLSTLLGLGTSLALAILDIFHHDGLKLEDWINVALWSFILIQAVSTILSRSPTKSFANGARATISSICLFALCLFEDSLIVENQTAQDDFSSSATFWLRISQLILALFAAISGIYFPRRPHVTHNKRPVDGMLSVSAFGRFTFSWVGDILALASDKKRLELQDLPTMDHYTRAKDLSEAWEERKHTKALWIEIFLAHKSPFVFQWILTVFQAFGNFAPQFVTYQILKMLEVRQPGDKVPFTAWIWVTTLFLVTLAAAWIESWMFWISWSELAIPIRSQLSSQIFQKAMRRKDVKGAARSGKKSMAVTSEVAQGSIAQDKPEDNEEEDSDPKGRQSTVNLIGVDAKRLSDFCSFNNYFPGAVFKLIVSFSFLISIIGWQSLVAGMLAMSLTIPLNIYFSKRYSAAQDRLMKVRDVKMAVVTEALQGIRQIKFSALESNWGNKIGLVRKKELDEQWSVYLNDTMLLFCWITSPIALAAVALAVYAYLHGVLLPSVAFTAIGVFVNLEVTLSVIPELTTDLIDAYISIKRIQRYLDGPEISENTSDAPNVSFEKASIAWPCAEGEDEMDGNERYVLRNVDVSFPKGELSVISGKTGTGKSLMLASILGEVDILAGKVHVPRGPRAADRHDHLANKDNWIIPTSIAFVAQIPWIENASIKDNILFGLPLDEGRYQKVIEYCALRKDLEMLGDGEHTEIGANGINLSGGQRWRVTFARALYSRAGILVLDDIFSAVDAHVGRFIYEKGLTGELGVGRTRILVTHHVALCKAKAKYLVELGDGTVESAGFLSDLEEAGTLERIISHEETSEQIAEDEAPITESESSTVINASESSDDENTNGNSLTKVQSRKEEPKKFVEEETREQGRVKGKVYGHYIKASGGWSFWSLAVIAFIGQQFLITGRSWWLRLWTASYEESSIPTSMFKVQIDNFPLYGSTHNSSFQAESIKHNTSYYLIVYVCLSAVSAIVGTLRYFWIYTGSIRASKILFDRLCFTVLRTPLRWMDTVPLGRILNRFTTDFNVVDGRLANDIGFGANNLFALIGIICTGIFVSPWILLMSSILLALCVYIAILYLPGAREVKRIESISKSPIFEQFGSALTGVGTIRAFDKTDVYIKSMWAKIDNHSTSFWHLWAFNRWMGWRMSFIGAFFATIVAIVIILIPSIDAALAGFALSFALSYGQTVIWTIRHYTNLELNMNAAERIIEYSNLKTESLDGPDPPAAWPTEGRLEVNDLVVSYADDLPPILKGLTFRVERSERIGVVGRTGAGKSSLTLALFRFLEAREGTIHIDGLDISKINLHSLRSRLAIIPQDPVLFSGTVRSNLDAFDDHTDSELRDALERVQLIPPSGQNTPSTSGTSTPSLQRNKNPFTSLTSPITEGGLNLSQGQRQLLCLARAIVSHPKIMVLDEATSAVDMETDALIQRSIRQEFTDSTLIVIAHRLSTIADFDKILVLGEGKVVEFGTPKELWELSEGVFKGMVKESGERSKLEDMILMS